MLTLNLLPERHKEEYIFEKKRRFAVFFGVSLCVIAFVFCALLFATYFFLVIQEKSFRASLDARRSASASQRLHAVKKDISALNKKVDLLKIAQGGMYPLAPVLEKISLLIEPGVSVESVSLDAQAKAASMSGFAETRESVLALAAALAQSDFILSGSLQSPIQNILKEKGVRFSFAFTLR